MELKDGYRIEASPPELWELVFSESDILYGGELYGAKLLWLVKHQLIPLVTYYRLLRILGSCDLRLRQVGKVYHQ